MSSHVFVKQARALGPSSGHETWFAQHVPGASGEHAALPETSRLHFMTPGQSVPLSHAIIVAQGMSEATDMPDAAAASALK